MYTYIFLFVLFFCCYTPSNIQGHRMINHNVNASDKTIEISFRQVVSIGNQLLYNNCTSVHPQIITL